jgi:hypothetical protein
MLRGEHCAADKGGPMKTVVLSLVLIIGFATGGRAADPADEAAIKRTALDYAEGWYEGNGERMERALHPELAKRIVITNPKTGRSRLEQMSALTLINGVRGGGGKETPAAEQLKEVTILDVYGGAASVKVVMSGWIDYLHVARSNGEWRIVNVLWELKPDKR